MMIDKCMDSGENRNEYVGRKVREYLYAINLLKKRERWQMNNKKPHVRKPFEPRRKYLCQSKFR